MKLFGGAPLILDFEASCLAGPRVRSYPIELAIGDPAAGSVRSWLIRPEPVWLAEWDWAPESERIHGISQAQLLAEGRPRAEVAREVRASLQGRTAFSDNPAYEAYWLAVLLDEAVPVGDLIDWYWQIVGRGVVGAALLELAFQAARNENPERHRAAKDVAFHMTVLERLRAAA